MSVFTADELRREVEEAQNEYSPDALAMAYVVECKLNDILRERVKLYEQKYQS